MKSSMSSGRKFISSPSNNLELRNCLISFTSFGDWNEAMFKQLLLEFEYCDREAFDGYHLRLHSDIAEHHRSWMLTTCDPRHATLTDFISDAAITLQIIGFHFKTFAAKLSSPQLQFCDWKLLAPTTSLKTRDESETKIQIMTHVSNFSSMLLPRLLYFFVVSDAVALSFRIRYI